MSALDDLIAEALVELAGRRGDRSARDAGSARATYMRGYVDAFVDPAQEEENE